MAGIDFSYFVDLVMFSVSLGITYFVYFLYKAFKGGVMGFPFKVLTLSMALLTLSEVLSLAGSLAAFFLQVSFLQIIQQGLEIGFLLLALFGFYKLYAFWRFDFVSQIQNIDTTLQSTEPLETV